MQPSPWHHLEERQKTCQGKKAYVHPKEADRIRGYRERDTGTPLAVYRCPHCEKWHMTRKVNGQHAKLYLRDPWAIFREEKPLDYRG